METFFSLMLSGYATDTKPEIISRFPGDKGTKRNIWKDSKGWIGIDEWRTTEYGDGSNGTTSIYYNKVLVWEMQYGGSYPKQAIPALQEALRENYIQKRWFGGRGPLTFPVGKFIYHNMPILVEADDPRCSFDSFGGTEYIEECVDGVWTNIGQHFYRGGFLINPST